jgi:type IV secretion system protein VirB9
MKRVLGSMVRAVRVGVLLVPGATSLVRAEAIPTPGITDERIRSAVYHADEVYRLTGRVGYQVDLQFAADERFVGLAAGDIDALSFEAQDNHLFLKPKAPRVATNLTVLTTRRQYHLDYSVQPPHASPSGLESAPSIYALRFAYPEDDAARAQAAAAARTAAADDAALGRALTSPAAAVNARYAYCGPRAIKPTSVTDDGVHTFFVFGGRTELPAVFTRAADGSESLVNFTVTAEGLTVHRIAERFVLRRGRLVGCVVNQAFDGAGARLATGTVSPGVDRTLPVVPDAVGHAP